MSFLHHPRQVRARKLLLLFHLWAGLIIGFFLMVVGMTGSILVFSDDIQQRLAVHIEADRSGAPLGIEELNRIAQARFPDVHLSYISLPASPGDAAVVSSQDPVSHRNGNIFLHPGTGKILAETVSHEAFLDWVYRVHVYLLAGDSGYFCNGIMAAVGTGLCLSGLVIWWPGLKLWKPALVLNHRARWKRVNYDLHRSFGFFSALSLGAVLLTGVYFRFPQPFIYALEAVSGSKAHDFFLNTPARSLPVIPVAQALAAGETALPGCRTVALGLARDDLHYFRVDRRLPDGERRTVAVDAYSGRVLDISSEHPLNFVDRILSWSGPIHFGTWGGRVTQGLWVFLGLTPGLLFVSGVLMYWNRVLSKKLNRLRARQREDTAVGV